jgi:hypothetical protein
MTKRSFPWIKFEKSWGGTMSTVESSAQLPGSIA